MLTGRLFHGVAAASLNIRNTTCLYHNCKALYIVTMEVCSAINDEGKANNLMCGTSDEENLKKKWEREQNELKEKMLLEDVDVWSKFKIIAGMDENVPQTSCLKYVGGADLSFIKGDDVNACAAFVVLELPELKVIYKDLTMVQMTAPYVPGFLAFREVQFLKEKIDKLKNTQPSMLPQVVLVDGNGILHPRGFGLACHLGVLTDLPTIGVAKNLLCVDGIERDEKFKQQIKTLHNAGEWLPLIGTSGKQHGVMYRSCKETSNPIYISPGHKISMETAIWVVKNCIKFRIPEPTRQADILSREYIRCLSNKEENVRQSSQKKKSNGKPQKGSGHADANLTQTCDNESYLDAGLNLWNN